jgi:glycosyltransferase involved in cell wall biosynthesis
MFSVLILTKNEEIALPGCLASVSYSDDIHVYDSFSTDRTVEIAKVAGAHVTQRRFDNWAAHQNHGLQTISFKHPWVFYLDADERMTQELEESIKTAIKDPALCVAFRLRRRDFFLGCWLKHVQATPFYMRLFRPDKMRYERLVNPVSIADGQVATIDGYLDHFPFSKGISAWMERHNSYSTLEASQISLNRTNGESFSVRKALFAEDFNVRRFHQKELFFRLPARPIVKFLLLYFMKCGFLDGYSGLVYAILQTIYEYLIILKVREMRSRDSDSTHSIDRDRSFFPSLPQLQ